MTCTYTAGKKQKILLKYLQKERSVTDHTAKYTITAA
jgi:hypothetical protein